MPKSKSKENAIVVCCTPNWLAPAACTLKSCFDHGGAKRADFFVVSLGLSAKDKEEFQAFIEKHKFSATLIEGILPQKIIRDAPKRFSAAAFLRLTLDHIVDPSYKRVLYLDSDVLALSHMDQIFDIDLAGKCLGAVEDCQSFPDSKGRPAKRPHAIGLDRGSRYFNSGMLLFDWQKVSQNKKLPQCVDMVLSPPQSRTKLRFPDQDILNLVFAGDWQRLPMTYNLISVVSDYFPEKPVFRHFTKDHKPWHKVRGIGYAQYRKLYQAMLAGTPWAAFTEKGIARVSPLETLGMYLRSKDWRRRELYSRHLKF